MARGLVLWGLLTLACAVSCVDEPPACYHGEYRACRCDEGVGYQRCEQGSYASCVCDGTTPGLEGGFGGEGGGLLAFMEPCDEDAACDSGLCYLFNAKGPHCSKACSSDEACPPPSTGCNMKGVCRAP